MKLTTKIFRFLLSLRGRQLRLEREKIRSLEETKMILSAYLSMLIEKEGCIRVSRSSVRESMGKYRAEVEVDGDDYVIRMVPAFPSHEEGEDSPLC